MEHQAEFLSEALPTSIHTTSNNNNITTGRMEPELKSKADGENKDAFTGIVPNANAALVSNDISEVSFQHPEAQLNKDKVGSGNQVRLVENGKTVASITAKTTVVETEAVRDDSCNKCGTLDPLSTVSILPTAPMPPNKSKGTNSGRVLVYMKLLIHFILLLAFVPLVGMYCLRCIHDEIWVPLLTRAQRTNDDLMDEFTYYFRTCTVPDITASKTNAQDLILQNHSAVDQVMTHGAAMIPRVLSEENVQRLREFVVNKNAAIDGTEAEFPLSQGYNRISYGIEATEHPAVIDALKEIHDNADLENTLQGLLGTNPAATEITAITAYYGCEDQVWHPDVKPDGNGLMWARTYSHSYSLFITLQDTTGDMGATDLCPGTHYCADDELYTLCQQHKIGLNEVGGNGYWKAGDGFLLNQQVWHRGTKHVDPYAKERIVFIVSFLSRPTDPRQLSRGTYFHMKWNMWGHTWQDLGDAVVSMSRPFNILRCLHIWKPKTRDWGYDLITATALRIANLQMEHEDVYRFRTVIERLGLPEFLHGPMVPGRKIWHIYIDNTIENVTNFFVDINVKVLCGCFILTLLSALGWQIRYRNGGLRLVWNSFLRVLATHGIVIVLAIYLLETIRATKWVTGIASGRTLMRPFPSLDDAWVEDPSVPSGPSTLPTRRDVLHGTRYDAKSLGAYSRWLDFHPGNSDFRQHISEYSPQLYTSYEKGLPPAFHQYILDSIMEHVKATDGRFIRQDYRTGDWRVMKPSEAKEYTRWSLVTGTSGLTAEIRQELDFMMANYRFGFFRSTVLARLSQTFLRQIATEIFGTLPKPPKTAREPDQSSLVESFLFPIKSKRDDIKFTPLSLGRKCFYSIAHSKDSRFHVGSMITFRPEQNWRVRGTVIGERNGMYEVAFHEDFAAYYRLVERLPHNALRLEDHVIERSRVYGNYHGEGELFPGVITHVYPNGMLQILYDDGDLEDFVVPENYVVI